MDAPLRRPAHRLARPRPRLGDGGPIRVTTTNAMLRDAFGHHNWASLVVLDACAGLTDEQLIATVPGVYGSILDTLRHLVEADVWYLHTLTDPRVPTIDESTMRVAELRAEMALNGP